MLAFLFWVERRFGTKLLYKISSEGKKKLQWQIATAAFS